MMNSSADSSRLRARIETVRQWYPSTKLQLGGRRWCHIQLCLQARNGVKTNTIAGTRSTTPCALLALPGVFEDVVGTGVDTGVGAGVAATAVGAETAVTENCVSPAELRALLREFLKVVGFILVMVFVIVAATFAME